MNIFLPFISKASNPTTDFVNLIANDPRQKRVLKHSEGLTLAAQSKVALMIEHNIFDHVVAGIYPNQLARVFVELPDYYAILGNNIESLVMGSKDVNLMFEALANSPSHAKHLFGLTPFFAEQTHIGIGYSEGHNNYWWSVYIAKIAY